MALAKAVHSIHLGGFAAAIAPGSLFEADDKAVEELILNGAAVPADEDDVEEEVRTADEDDGGEENTIMLNGEQHFIPDGYEVTPGNGGWFTVTGPDNYEEKRRSADLPALLADLADDAPPSE